MTRINSLKSHYFIVFPIIFNKIYYFIKVGKWDNGFKFLITHEIICESEK